MIEYIELYRDIQSMDILMGFEWAFEWHKSIYPIEFQSAELRASVIEIVFCESLIDILEDF